MAKTWAAPFPQVPALGNTGIRLTAAMTAATAWDGTATVGTAMALVKTFNATDGGFLDSVRAKITSTAGAAPSGVTNATVVRLWLNNGTDHTVAANNFHLDDIELPATDVSELIARALRNTEYRVDRFHPVGAGWRLYAGLTNAIGGTNCAVQVYTISADYA